MGTHQALDSLLKDGRISGEAYLVVKDALETDAKVSSPSQPSKPRSTKSFVRGVVLNFAIQCVVLELYIMFVFFLHGTSNTLGLYILLMPAMIALYHLVFLPASELAYQVLRRFTNMSRLPVYITVAWILLVPMMFLLQPVAD